VETERPDRSSGGCSSIHLYTTSSRALRWIPTRRGYPLNEQLQLDEPIKPARTRWNTYCDCFARAIELRTPLDNYIAYKTEEHNREAARFFIQEGGLTTHDWATIVEYKHLLTPFEDATAFMEGRGEAGIHGAIWEVIPTFDWPPNRLQELRDQLREVNYESDDAPEDHLLINLNATYLKIDEYYSKLNRSAAYYAACRLHPAYKNFVDVAWREPDDYDNTLEPHPRKGWIEDLNRGFNKLWNPERMKRRRRGLQRSYPST